MPVGVLEVSGIATPERLTRLLRDRRARAGGLGVFLATQNPGDLDARLQPPASMNPEEIERWTQKAMQQE